MKSSNRQQKILLALYLDPHQPRGDKAPSSFEMSMQPKEQQRLQKGIVHLLNIEAFSSYQIVNNFLLVKVSVLIMFPRLLA